MIHPRCDTCPIVGPCVVEWTRDPTFCGWAARGGISLDRVRELSAKGPPPVVVRMAAPAKLAPLVRVDYGTSPDGPPRSRCCGQQ